MPKFANLVPRETPWTANITAFLDTRITINDLEPVNTAYGQAFVADCDVHNVDGSISDDFKLLIGGTVLVDQMNKLLTAMRIQREDFPVDVMVRKVRSGTSGLFYHEFVDPDETEDTD